MAGQEKKSRRVITPGGLNADAGGQHGHTSISTGPFYPTSSPFLVNPPRLPHNLLCMVAVGSGAELGRAARNVLRGVDPERAPTRGRGRSTSTVDVEHGFSTLAVASTKRAPTGLYSMASPFKDSGALVLMTRLAGKQTPKRLMLAAGDGDGGRAQWRYVSLKGRNVRSKSAESGPSSVAGALVEAAQDKTTRRIHGLRCADG